MAEGGLKGEDEKYSAGGSRYIFSSCGVGDTVQAGHLEFGAGVSGEIKGFNSLWVSHKYMNNTEAAVDRPFLKQASSQHEV